MSFLSVNHLISDRADHNAGESLLRPPPALSFKSLPADTFILGVPNKSFDIHSYTVRELDLGATLLAHHYASVGVPSRARGDATTQHTVALLAPSNFDCQSHVYVLILLDADDQCRRRERAGTMPHGARNVVSASPLHR